jgi:hypothetical protein
MKRNDCRRSFDELRALHKIAHELLVPKMHAVEIAYGGYHVREIEGQLLQTADYLHVVTPADLPARSPAKAV